MHTNPHDRNHEFLDVVTRGGKIGSKWCVPGFILIAQDGMLA